MAEGACIHLSADFRTWREAVELGRSERLRSDLVFRRRPAPDGKPISAAEFVERLFGELPALFKDEDDLRQIWSRPDTRKALLESLAEKGFAGEQLAEISRIANAENSDLYDVLAYIAFALPPMTRSKRVETHRDDIFARCEPRLQEFLDFVSGQYVLQGVSQLNQDRLGTLLELKYHTIGDAADQLGDVSEIRDAFVGFQRYLYERAGAGSSAG